MEQALAEYLSHAPVFVRRKDGQIIYWTQGAEELYGFSADEAVGENAHTLLQTVFPRALSEINGELDANQCWEGLVSHTRKSGSKIWTESRWRLRGGPGQSLAVVETNTDVTHRENLARELDHRVKNTLAIVQGLARMSLQGSDEQRLEAFETRLQGLATAHDILVRSHWEPASLKSVIVKATEAFGVQDRFDISGEDILLEPRSVVAYSLAFHELATNAVKHGALLRSEGRVTVKWDLLDSAGERIHLKWRELGGPPPVADPSAGGGTRLLQRVVAKELGAEITLSFLDSGLVCEFDGAVQKTSQLS